MSTRESKISGIGRILKREGFECRECIEAGLISLGEEARQAGSNAASNRTMKGRVRSGEGLMDVKIY